MTQGTMLRAVLVTACFAALFFLEGGSPVRLMLAWLIVMFVLFWTGGPPSGPPGVQA